MSTIETKPTEYKGVLYRSRLEARWAVYLDAHPHIRVISYEPQITPYYKADFHILFDNTRYGYPAVLEIKPAMVSVNYLQELYANISQMSSPCPRFYLMIGDFYEDQPTLYYLNGPRFNRGSMILGSKLGFTDIGDNYALTCAAGYRFDLAQPEPPRKKGFRRYASEPSTSKKRKRPPL